MYAARVLYLKRRYTVRVEIRQGGRLISENQEEIEVVRVHGLHEQLF